MRMSEYPRKTSIANDDIFLVNNEKDGTKGVAYDTVKQYILSLQIGGYTWHIDTDTVYNKDGNAIGTMASCMTDDFIGNWFYIRTSTSEAGSAAYPAKYTIDGANGHMSLRDYVIWTGKRLVHVSVNEAKAASKNADGKYGSSTGVDGLMSSTDKAYLTDLINAYWNKTKMPVYPNPDPAEGWQTNWLFADGWYLGGIKKNCGGHPPVLGDNHTSWAVLVLNGMDMDGTQNHNHRLQIAFDLANSKIYMRRGWMSDNTWADSWSEVGAIADGGIATSKLANQAVTEAKLSAELQSYIGIVKNLTAPMQFKGVISAFSDWAAIINTDKNWAAGWTWVIGYNMPADQLWDDAAAEAGDLLIAVKDCDSDFTLSRLGEYFKIMQSNIDGAVTGPTEAPDGCLAAFSGTSGRIIKSSLIDAERLRKRMDDYVLVKATDADGVIDLDSIGKTVNVRLQNAETFVELTGDADGVTTVKIKLDKPDMEDVYSCGDVRIFAVTVLKEDKSTAALVAGDETADMTPRGMYRFTAAYSFTVNSAGWQIMAYDFTPIDETKTVTRATESSGSEGEASSAASEYIVGSISALVSDEGDLTFAYADADGSTAAVSGVTVSDEGDLSIDNAAYSVDGSADMTLSLTYTPVITEDASPSLGFDTVL